MDTTHSAGLPDADSFSLPIGGEQVRSGAARLAGLQVAGLLALLAAVASIPLTVIYSTWATHRGMIREWQTPGPACPVATTPSTATRGAKPPPPFVYKGVSFAYPIGNAVCAAVPVENVFSHATFPACNFNAPAAIEVTAGGRRVLFEPGIGRSATVTIRDGRIRCVMATGFHN